jgi:putative flavoprotein involved in K+ transport
VLATRDTRVTFADDLLASVAFGDARAAELRDLLRRLPDIPLDAQELADPAPFRADPVTELDLSGFGAVITTSGFRPDYSTWVDLPVFDELGFPITDNECAAAPGLYFCGVHFLQRRSSSLMFGVGRDATTVAASIARLR